MHTFRWSLAASLQEAELRSAAPAEAGAYGNETDPDPLRPFTLTQLDESDTPSRS
jgi:hypothetical protein